MAYMQTLQASGHLGTFLTRRRKANKKFMAASLMLTPMVDMFSLLVIFLLQFFSASPEFQLTQELELPTSISSTEIADAPTVSVTPEKVFIEKELVGNLAELLKNPAPLSDHLLKVREKWQAEHPDQEFIGKINLEADQGLESTKISQMMMILSAHHFGSINLLAIGEG